MADICNFKNKDEKEMMSDTTLKKLIEYLKKQGWSDNQIVSLLEYIADK